MLSRIIASAAALFTLGSLPLASQQSLQPQAHPLLAGPNKPITLNLPAGLDIHVAATGLRRLRFFALAPDGRIFATGMHNLADNTQGVIYIVDGYNPQTHHFTRITPYLEHLRNPNNVAFFTDPQTHQSWIYVPLTDKLVRFPYKAGDLHPSGPARTLLRFPDYGLSYKYGGWHLTRTVAVATLHGKPQVYVAVGSSCNYCQEREVARAAVLRLDPDGKNPAVVARGLRNAVALHYVPELDGGALFATNMGDDHLGKDLPEDTFFELDSNLHPGPIASVPDASHAPNYGWPTCYFAHGQPVHDTTPLPELPKPGDLRIEAERPRAAGIASHGAPAVAPKSVYGKQSADIAEAGTNLAAGGGHIDTPDPDAALGKAPAPLQTCDHVPPAYTTFRAHASPLGFAYFGDDNPILRDSFLVSLHGSGDTTLGAGYRIVRFTPTDRKPQDAITGFITRNASGTLTVHGRPCGILRLGPDRFLLSDDYDGAIYIVEPSHR